MPPVLFRRLAAAGRQRRCRQRRSIAVDVLRRWAYRIEVCARTGLLRSVSVVDGLDDARATGTRCGVTPSEVTDQIGRPSLSSSTVQPFAPPEPLSVWSLPGCAPGPLLVARVWQ